MAMRAGWRAGVVLWVVLQCALPGLSSSGSSGGFVVGDVWRGMLTSCTQPPDDAPRAKFHSAIVVEMIIEKAAEDGMLRTVFQANAFGVAYEMNGFRNLTTGRIRLHPGSWVSEQKGYWTPCAVDGWLSKDFVTFSAIALCGNPPIHECDPGGGEAILRHSRVRFEVAGAGVKAVNGKYRSVKSDHLGLNPDLYAEGVVLMQECAPAVTSLRSGDDEDCERHIMIHRVLGMHRFWMICPLQDEDAGPALFIAWSEDPEPPFGGWRPLRERDGPPPAVMVDISASEVHERIEPPTAPFRSARRDVVFGGWLVLVVFGALLWTIVLYAGLRFTRCRSNRNLGRLK